MEQKSLTKLLSQMGCLRTVQSRLQKKYGAIVVENKKRHAAGGRNAGIKRAKGDIIAFIDADCIPDKDWLKEIRKAFEEDDIDGLGTYIRPAKSDNKYEEFWGRLSLQILMSYGDEPYYVQDKTLNTAFITASCAYRRSLLCRIKGFNNFFCQQCRRYRYMLESIGARGKTEICAFGKDYGTLSENSERNL